MKRVVINKTNFHWSKQKFTQFIPIYLGIKSVNTFLAPINHEMIAVTQSSLLPDRACHLDGSLGPRYYSVILFFSTDRVHFHVSNVIFRIVLPVCVQCAWGGRGDGFTDAGRHQKREGKGRGEPDYRLLCYEGNKVYCVSFAWGCVISA